MINFEKFSPQAVAGIEKFRKTMRDNKIPVKNSVTEPWMTNPETGSNTHLAAIFQGMVIGEGSTIAESWTARQFAVEHKFWTRRNKETDVLEFY
jgi:hypothetical protein